MSIGEETREAPALVRCSIELFSDAKYSANRFRPRDSGEC